MYARAVTMSLLLACSPEPKPLAVWAGDCKLYDLPNTVAEQVCAGSETFFMLPSPTQDREVIVADEKCGGSWKLYMLAAKPSAVDAVYDCKTGERLSLYGRAVYTGSEYTPTQTTQAMPVESK